MTDAELVERVARAIDEEPELPGEMPDAMRIVLEQAIDTRDMDLLIELLRITIRQTKRGIKERVSAIPRPVSVGRGDDGGKICLNEQINSNLSLLPYAENTTAKSAQKIIGKAILNAEKIFA